MSTEIPLVFTLKQVSQMLQVSQNTVRRAIRDGRLQASRLGGNDLRIKRSAVEQWIENSTTFPNTTKKEGI